MMNKVLLIGRLARDPELKEFNNGGALANLRVMTNRTWRDKTGDMRSRADGHTVVVHAETVARRLATALHKGHLVYVEGVLENRQWQDANGTTRYTTEVAVRPYLGTVRKMPGNSAAALDTPTDPNPEVVDGPETTAPEPPTTPNTDAQEIDFFADAGLSDSNSFDF